MILSEHLYLKLANKDKQIDVTFKSCLEGGVGAGIVEKDPRLQGRRTRTSRKDCAGRPAKAQLEKLP